MRRWCLWAAGAAEIEGKADWESGGEGGGGWDAAGASAWTKHMDGGAHGWKSRLQRRGNPYRWSDDATDETTWDLCATDVTTRRTRRSTRMAWGGVTKEVPYQIAVYS